MLRFLLFAFCLSPFALPAQSPWTRSKAGFYAQAAWQFIPTYDAIFDQDYADDTRNLEREITENAVRFYGEYGIKSNFTVWTAIPIRFVKSGEATSNMTPQLASGSLNGLGNITLAARASSPLGKLTLTGQLRIDLPSGPFDESTGLRTGFKEFTFLPTLSIGRSYGKYYWFTYLGAGSRSKKTSRFFDLGGEGGARLGKCWLIGFTEFWSSFTGTPYEVPPTNTVTGLFLPYQSYWSVGGKAIYEFNRFWGVIATAAGALQGDLVPQQPTFSLGTYFKWD